MKFFIFLLLLFSLQSCFLRPPSLTITDKYLLIKNPGQSWSLTEVKPITMDSIFHYPSKQEIIVNYNLVKRKDGRSVNGNKKIKIYFNKKSNRYKWMYYKSYADINKNYSDTISLKPFVWYHLAAANNTYQKYFYWNGKDGDFIIKEKPNPGAW